MKHSLPVSFISLVSFVFLVSLVFPGCQTTKKSGPDLATIDVIAGLNQEKEFRLSELVDSIEYIKLETSKECLVSVASKVIGKKYILLLNHRPQQILLFDRGGKFLRQIGKIGKGPGEYTYPYHIDLSPDEDKIIAFDMAQSLILEFSVDGSFLTSHKSPSGLEAGPYYLDKENIAFLTTPYSDSMHYPHVRIMNLLTKKITPVYFIDFRRNPDQQAGVYLQNSFHRTDEGIIFKHALSDTIYQLSSDFSVKPIFALHSFPNKPIYTSMTEQEIEGVSTVDLSCLTPKFLFFIGTEKERFHLVYNPLTKEISSLPKIRECRTENDYAFGIINDLDGTEPIWFWGGSYLRDSRFANLLQIIDLKEMIKTDCFNKADLKTNQYRDQLRKLVEASSENDNPILRVMHLKR